MCGKCSDACPRLPFRSGFRSTWKRIWIVAKAQSKFGGASSKPFPGLVQDALRKEPSATSDRDLNEFAKKLDKDPTFKKDSKGWDRETKDRCRGLLEPYADDPLGMLVGQSMCEGLSGIWDVGKEYQQCIASDDPRLKGN